MAILKVEGHSNLIKETRTKAIINTNTSEYNIYMARIKQRNEQSDKLRSAVKEINTLKAKFFYMLLLFYLIARFS